MQKSGDKTSSGEIGLDIRTYASPKLIFRSHITLGMKRSHLDQTRAYCITCEIKRNSRLKMEFATKERTVCTMEIEKICYDNPGNMPYKGRNFNTQTFGKMYLFVICMINRHRFQTKLLLYIA